jgi:hypothetical protein
MVDFWDCRKKSVSPTPIILMPRSTSVGDIFQLGMRTGLTDCSHWIHNLHVSRLDLVAMDPTTLGAGWFLHLLWRNSVRHV